MAAIAALEERRAAVPEMMDNQEMMVDINDTFVDLCDVVGADLEGLMAFGDKLAMETSESGQMVIDDFTASGNDEAAAKNEAMDELQDKWAFFLKHNFAFEPYDQESYLGYVQGN